MNFETDDIARITSDACAMFGLDVADDAQHAGVGTGLAGTIAIEGSWTGSVSMGCSQAFARRLAATMFEMPEEELDTELVNDAFGELVNVTAGNIKALLPSGCRMSTPSVVEAELEQSDGDTQVQLWGFRSSGELLNVIIRAA